MTVAAKPRSRAKADATRRARAEQPAPKRRKAKGARVARRRRAEPKPPEPSRSRNRRTAPKSSEAARPARAPRRSLRERWSSSRERLASVWERVRRPLWIVARIALVLLVAAGAVAVGRLVEQHVRTSPAFATKAIELEGRERLSREEVLEAAGLALDQNVFEVAPEDAQARLEAHPWIAEATVRRRLPGTFEVTIREHHAAAVLALARSEGASDTLYLVSEDGTVFKRVTEGDPLDLPVITGVDRSRFARDRAFRTWLLVEVVALLHDYRDAGLWRREPIAEVHVEPDDGFTLYVGDDAAQVRLGRGPFRKKLRRLGRVLDRLREREARPAYVYLDNVRRPDRVTVRLR